MVDFGAKSRAYCSDDLKLVKVHECASCGLSRENIELQCLSILQDEWPSPSDISRRRTLLASSDSLPCSFALCTPNQTVVAHCILRRAAEVADGRAVVLYSVVVTKSLRRRGIGRLLIKVVEAAAINMGFSCTLLMHHFRLFPDIMYESDIYLSTPDQERFYRKCGYTACEPVSSMGSASRLLDSEQVR